MQKINSTSFCFSIILVVLSCKTIAQTEIIKSKINFNTDQLENFYSSFVMDNFSVYINSNDYYIHAVDKKSGEIKWSHYLANKTNIKPVQFKGNILVGKHFSEYTDRCIELNSKTGDTIKTLKIDKLETNPTIIGNIIFGTAINPEIGGAVLAYDMEENKIIWQQFVAHGVSTQPYFIKDKIVANAENNNWFEIDYNGIFKDTLCKNQASIFVENIKCVKKFTILTHDEKELDEAFLKNNLNETENILQKSNEEITILLANDKLLILGNNKKIKQKVDLTKILLPLDKGDNTYREILKIEGETIWFFYDNLLVAYNYKVKKTTQVYDLTQWNIHQIQMEVDNLKVWLISKNDGQLYGLKL